LSLASASSDRGRLSPVPLAWRNLTANKRRLARSGAGIGFAVLLMLMQLGFEQAFFDSSLQVIRGLDGDFFLQSAHKYQFATQDPFSAATLNTAARMTGIATARPLYADWYDVFWKNPSNGKVFLVRALAFDPDEPVFLFADVNGARQQLSSPNTILVDRRARRFLGMNPPKAKSELNGTPVTIVGSFALGPDFQNDGTVIMSTHTFARLLHGAAGNPPGIEVGVIKLVPGANPVAVQSALRKGLPRTIAVMTKPELIAFERRFQAAVSSAGPIFAIGTVVGFVVGMLISYQVTYTDVSDQLPQYATLKAIGYPTRFLLRVVLEQAVLNGLTGWIPAWLAGILLYRVIAEVALLPMRMSPEITLLSLALTLGMCLTSSAIAVRRVIATDPAEVF
jgi:putative ABC transport system permease protein